MSQETDAIVPTDPPTTKRKPPSTDTRRRMTLNLSAEDMARIERLAAHEHSTIHDAIRRAVAMRWKIHLHADPRMAYPDLQPEDLPPIRHLELVEDVTGDRIRLEIL